MQNMFGDFLDWMTNKKGLEIVRYEYGVCMGDCDQYLLTKADCDSLTKEYIRESCSTGTITVGEIRSLPPLGTINTVVNSGVLTVATGGNIEPVAPTYPDSIRATHTSSGGPA